MDNNNMQNSSYSPAVLQCENTTRVKKNSYSPIHAVFALIAFVIGSLWFQWIFQSKSIGIFRPNISVTVFAFIFVAFTFVFFKVRKASFTRDSYFLLSILIVFSLRFCVYPGDYSEISTLALLVLHLVALLFVFSFGDNKSLDNIVGSCFRSVVVSPFASFYTIFAALSGFLRLRKNTTDTKQKLKKFGDKLGLVLLGILISVPIVIVVVSLLATDSFFSSFIGNIGRFTLDIDLNIEEYFNYITILVSMYIFGALYSADKKRSEEPASPINYRFIPGLIGKTITVILLLVYGLFIIAQIDGFTCLFMQRLPENTTYAEFARSGFFELCFASCINGALLYYLNILTLKEDENKKSKSILQVALVCVTFFLILTAASKMIMYISAYGFTPKRFYTLWFMLLLTIIFSLVLVKLKRVDFRLSRYCVYVTAVMLLVLFFVDFEGIAESLNGVYFPEELIS